MKAVWMGAPFGCKDFALSGALTRDSKISRPARLTHRAIPGLIKLIELLHCWW